MVVVYLLDSRTDSRLLNVTVQSFHASSVIALALLKALLASLTAAGLSSPLVTLSTVFSSASLNIPSNFSLLVHFAKALDSTT